MFAGMGERASQLFPFGIAIVLPPAGLILGLLNIQQDEKELGLRLIVVSVLAAFVWAFLFLA
jgi:hypothetical protein